jgi:Na+-transporting NADH:ubiquinone oxidoreductase subunit C
VIFTAVLCIVFSVLVSAVAVALHDRQVENRRLDRIQNVLGVAGLKEQGERLSREELTARFESGLEARVVELATGEYVDGVDALSYDQRRAAKDPDTSRPAPTNRAKVRRLPNQAVVYLIKDGSEISGMVLPIEGSGLWSTLYGFLALDADGKTVQGITYYSHGETPGLGGEVDNPRWKSRWAGRLAFDDAWQPALRVKKGEAGPPDADPYQVDGLSGATITSNGVTNMIQFWLGENGFGPYLARQRNQGEKG